MAKSKTEIHVTTVFDGELDATDVFVSLIAQKYSQRNDKEYLNGMEYTGMDAILAGSFRAAIYCRLSKDDDLDGESASIANQRDMLETYCEKQGWEVVAVYQDDGYTGLNMERPDLNVESHRAQAGQPCDYERFIEVRQELLADRLPD